MPIGAALGGAALTAGGSIIGSSKQAKAAKNAANMTAADNAANRTFLQGIYNQNSANFTPWATSGATANNAIMALLGYPQGGGQPPAFGGYGGSATGGAAFPGHDYGTMTLPGADSWESGGGGMPANGYGGGYDYVTTAVPDARSAFDIYRGSTGYDFRVNEGNRALTSAFSRNLESGAASKAAIRYGQGIGSDEFARYMGYLTGQSQMGLSGASALAGVAQNYGNTVVAGNQSATSAQANARLYAGNAQANMWAGLGSSFGQAMGAFGKGW